MDPFQPTLIYDANAPAPASEQGSPDVSRARIDFVAGDRPQFADETAALLRSDRPLSLFPLRCMELVIFGSVVLQMSLMLATRLAEAAVNDDAVAVAATRHQFLAAWCVLIFVYGIFMPNTWRRGAAVMIPMALVPYAIVAVQRWSVPGLDALLQADMVGTVVPFPLVAALVAGYAAQVITAARREAFKARQLGQYRLMEKLGSGGMGEVFRAEHVLLKRPCAIKLIKAANEANAKAITRFETEVKATAKLTHWNTVEIYDYGRTEDGTCWPPHRPPPATSNSPPAQFRCQYPSSIAGQPA